MPDIFDEDGLTVKTLTELVTELTDDLKIIYGSDINVDQNSPDGQSINIYSQGGVDLRELLVSIDNSFDPDNAIGRTLDARCRINNVIRNAGNFTIQPIEIVVSSTVDLEGLDADFNNINGLEYKIQDNSGNQYILIDSVSLFAGTYTKNFRAQDIGLIESTIGTINIPVTIVLGVDSVNNVSAPLEIGEDEEKDAELRIRRSATVALNSRAFLAGIQAKFLNLDGVEAAKVYENVSNITDADGIPGHSIWAIVEGGANTEIAEILYTKTDGCGMKGAIDIPLLTPAGQLFEAKFDRPVVADLHIQFNIKQTVSGFSFNEDAIKAYIKDNITYDIGESAYTTNITCVAQDGIEENGGGGVVLDLEISDDGIIWVDFLPTATKDKKWTIDVSNITITII